MVELLKQCIIHQKEQYFFHINVNYHIFKLQIYETFFDSTDIIVRKAAENDTPYGIVFVILYWKTITNFDSN